MRTRVLCVAAFPMIAFAGGTPAASPARIELFVVSGFCPVSSGSASGEACYLGADAGGKIATDLRAAGHEVVEREYADEESSYLRLVSDLGGARRDAGAGGTKIVLVAHSHGCVWAHAATRAVPDVPVDVLVDLDGTSFGWAFLSTSSIGDPRDALTGPDGRKHDLEDVVFPNVVENLEVRSGEHAVHGLMPELYDEEENVALAPASKVTTWNVGTNHSEVHEATGTTLPRVAAWVVDRCRPR